MNMPTPTVSRSASRCQGFTLIELLIAITVGLFLLGGVMTIVQDTRRATSSQNEATQLQDSVRLAMTMLTDVIQTTGYYTSPFYSTPGGVMLSSAPFVAGQSLSGTGAFGAAAPGDTISARYQTATGDGVLNCGGTSNITGSNGDLQCTLTSAAGTTPIVLIPAVTSATNPLQITNLQILYGVQTNVAAGNQCADSYWDANKVSATTVNGQTAWNYVVSVRITLSFTNPIAGQPALQFTRVIGIMSKMGIVYINGLPT
jgi:type IV pilus assembly protein PilW